MSRSLAAFLAAFVAALIVLLATRIFGLWPDWMIQLELIVRAHLW